MGYPTVSVVISTQFEKPEQLLAIANDLLHGSNNSPLELLFIVQVSDPDTESEAQRYFQDVLPFDGVRIVCFYEKGLARSRNRGIHYARGDVILLGDTDCRYPPDAVAKIQEAYQRFPEVGLITFEGVNRVTGDPIKKYWPAKRRHNIFSVMRVGSWEVTFRREEVLNKGALFDERFGLGSRWPSGAENIFMSDFLKNGGKGMFIPEVVVKTVSSNDRKMNCKIVYCKGVLLKRVWGIIGGVWGVPYLFRRYKQGNLQQGFFKSMFWLYKGWFDFRRGTTNPKR